MLFSLLTGQEEQDIETIKTGLSANHQLIQIERKSLFEKGKQTLSSPIGLLGSFSVGCITAFLTVKSKDQPLDNQDDSQGDNQDKQTSKETESGQSLWWSIPLFLFKFTNISESLLAFAKSVNSELDAANDSEKNNDQAFNEAEKPNH